MKQRGRRGEYHVVSRAGMQGEKAKLCLTYAILPSLPFSWITTDAKIKEYLCSLQRQREGGFTSVSV
jgi:hypothetical protein